MLASGFEPKNQPEFKSAVVGDYRLLALVGQGQFAQVYAAVHRRTGQLVAIKQTRHSSENASQEPLVMQQLDHPNIVRAQAISKTERGHQLVLEYCEGGTLRSHLTSTLDLPTPLPLPKTKQLISDILQGLGHIHQQGIVHGDLKPENIFLTYQPHGPVGWPARHSATQAKLRLKVGDFGNARFDHTPSRSRKEIGSPTYAAPERFSGKSSAASDLYSVGIILYELLLGNRPFSGSPEELKRAHQTQQIPFPSTITFAARRLLETALHKHPRHRFPNADAMLSALRKLTSTKTDHPQAPGIPKGLSHATLSQSLTPIPSNGITGPIEALLSVPQGCCIVTARSLHTLTHKRELLSIARFNQPCWISVSPSGKWFSAVTKRDSRSESKEEQNKETQSLQQSTTKSTGRYSSGMLGYLGEHSGHRWRRAITLAGPLLTALQAQVLQVIALDERYLLRVSTLKSRTYFECFTRHGQFIGECALDIPLAQVTRTMVPYQLMALSAPTPHADAAIMLITLNPFQVRHIHLPTLPAEPERINAFPWGYLVNYPKKGLLLDRSAQMAGLLTELPPTHAIAAINNQNILLASLKPDNTANSTASSSHSVRPPALLVADISTLDLGIIF